ncbi:hypothetical protein HK096_003931, partial [Nowakowskiella sp. JEL0078]
CSQNKSLAQESTAYTEKLLSELSVLKRRTEPEQNSSEIQALRLEVHALSSKCRIFADELETVRAGARADQEELVAEREEQQRLLQELDASQNAISLAVTERDEMTDLVSYLTDEKKKLEELMNKQIAANQEKESKFNENISRLEKELEKIKKESSATKTELQEDTQVISTLKAEINERNILILQRDEDISTKENFISELERLIFSKNTSVAALEARLIGDSVKYSNLTEKLESQLTLARTQIVALQARFDEQAAENLVLKEQNNKFLDLSSKNNLLEHELEFSKNSVTSLQVKLDNTTVELNQLSSHSVATLSILESTRAMLREFLLISPSASGLKDVINRSQGQVCTRLHADDVPSPSVEIIEKSETLPVKEIEQVENSELFIGLKNVIKTLSNELEDAHLQLELARKVEVTKPTTIIENRFVPIEKVESLEALSGQNSIITAISQELEDALLSRQFTAPPTPTPKSQPSKASSNILIPTSSEAEKYDEIISSQKSIIFSLSMQIQDSNLSHIKKSTTTPKIIEIVSEVPLAKSSSESVQYDEIYQGQNAIISSLSLNLEDKVKSSEFKAIKSEVQSAKTSQNSKEKKAENQDQLSVIDQIVWTQQATIASLSYEIEALQMSQQLRVPVESSSDIISQPLSSLSESLEETKCELVTLLSKLENQQNLSSFSAKKRELLIPEIVNNEQVSAAIRHSVISDTTHKPPSHTHVVKDINVVTAEEETKDSIIIVEEVESLGVAVINHSFLPAADSKINTTESTIEIHDSEDIVNELNETSEKQAANESLSVKESLIISEVNEKNDVVTGEVDVNVSEKDTPREIIIDANEVVSTEINAVKIEVTPSNNEVVDSDELLKSKLIQKDESLIASDDSIDGNSLRTRSLSEKTSLLADRRTSLIRSFSKRKDEKAPEITLTVHQARNLIAADRSGTSDPYVKIMTTVGTVAKNIHKTAIIKKNLNPTWNDTCSIRIGVDIGFDLPAVKLVLRDHNILKSDTDIGEATLDINSIISKSDENVGLVRFDEWLPVSGKGTGEIRVSGTIAK